MAKKRSIGEYSPKSAAEWRMLHVGFTALLSKKGVGTTNKRGIHMPYEFGNMRPWYARSKKAYFRVGIDPTWSKSFRASEEPEYMKLRNYSFNVFNEEWHGERPKEDAQERAVRAMWSSTGGGGAGSRMIKYMIDGLNRTVAGARSLMKAQSGIYAKNQGNIRIKLAEERMQKSLLKFIMNSKPQQVTVGGTKYWKPPGGGVFTTKGLGFTGLKIDKASGGIPIIKADSAEESKLFLASTFASNWKPGAAVEEIMTVESAIMQYRKLNKIRAANQKLDMVPGRNDEAFEASMDVLRKHSIEWSKAEFDFQLQKISGIETGMQPIEVRMARQWAAAKKQKQIEGDTRLKQLENFIEFSTKDYQPGPKEKNWLPELGEKRTREIRKNKTAGVPEELREEPFLVTQKLIGESRIMILVNKVQGEVVFGPIGYIQDFEGDMGDAVIRSLITDAEYADKVIARINQYSMANLLKYEGEKLQVTHNFYGSSANLEADAPQFQISTLTNPKLSKALYEMIVNESGGLRDWAEGGLEGIMTGDKNRFMLWFTRWMMEGERIAHQIDEASGQGSWKSWLLRKARPLWQKGVGGKMPSNLSGLMQPWEKAPRTWHPPLYVKPFAVQDKKGVGEVYAAERARLGL
tara:strand:- start:40 stop:1941 length:1902 start_codon:yes stop_codon:yes gene_type:complete